jgi:CubicO group peptidase (beta-lactamase class C family)
MEVRMKRKLVDQYYWKALFALLLALAAGLLNPSQVTNAGVDSYAQDRRDSQSTDADAWDDFFANQMKTFGVHGAEMVIVKGDQILFIKGYGYADDGRRIPMDPGSTIVRAGSIAKTLTVMAVMQLAEQGKLDLDADINRYLTRFKVADTFPQPVTTRQLINMTGGFDTRWVGIRATSAEKIIPLGEYLAQRMPPRVLPPGGYRRYNDHELALAGYLVEVISGKPYEQYVQEHIFAPLGMSKSSILLPERMLDQAARGYPVGGEAADAYPLNYYYLNDAPGAGFNTTAIDMSRYLMAHLNSSKVQLLRAETMRLLHATAFSYDTRLPGTANSFDERYWNGQRYLRKLGGAPGMQNNLILLPDQGLGFYLFTNTDGTALRNNWEKEVARRYLSNSADPIIRQQSTSGTDLPAEHFTGLFQEISDYTSDTTMVQVKAFLDPDLWVRVQAGPENSLIISGRRYVAVDDKVFQNPSSGDMVAFETDEGGRASFLFRARTAYRRIGWLETPTVQSVILVFSILVFLGGLVALTIQMRRGNASWTSLLPGLVSVLNLTFIAALVMVLMPVATGGDVWQFSLEPSIPLRITLALPIFTIGLAAVGLADTLTAWIKGRYGLFTRVYNSLILTGMAAFLYFLNTWNLLGWKF